MNAPERMVDFSADMKSLLRPYRDFLFREMYWHPSVADANEEAVRLMRRLFLHYIDHPETLGRKAQSRIESNGLWRTACDYVSGCTDRFAMEEVERFGLDK